jgi:hypothetical protein
MERKRPRGPVPHATSDAIAISVHARGPHVYFPASPDDLRAVLSRLPPGTATGLAGVELRLEEDPAERAGGKVDPFVGKLRHEIAPGVFGSRVLGRYTPDLARIQLFAYVCDPARSDRVVVDLYLRLQTLATFVHELAHHVDHATRGGRRQWRKEGSRVREAYAEAMEQVWTEDYVVPYLVETYPGDVSELARWLDTFGGTTLPLSALVIGTSSSCGVSRAFEELLTAVARGERPPATYALFAEGLRRAGR